MDKYKVALSHGSGGLYTKKLINDIFYKHFNNSILLEGLDSAVFEVESGKFAFTTDSFVVKPIFFRGGDIGKLAVCGTVNDLSVAGAKPLYISCGFIIEEGFLMEDLNKIAESMACVAEEAGVKIVTGDTKVVEKGSADGIYINTSGVGIVNKNYRIKEVMPGDAVIITGTIAEHGTAIAIERYNLKAKGDFKSDCTPINRIIERLEAYMDSIKIMKDPTRGGVAASLNEIAEYVGLSIHIFEQSVPIRKEVSSLSELLGIEPLYQACEGRAIIVVDKDESQEILSQISLIDNCKDAQIIGYFEESKYGQVFIENYFGGKRILPSPEYDMLPRIC